MAEKNTEEQTKIDNNQQEKLKEKVATQNLDDEIKQMSPEKLRQQLSNKNSDYVYRLQKELETQGKMSQDDALERVNALLADLVVAQRHGQPATTFYGMSPKLKAADILKPKPRTAADIPFWQYAVDSALLYIALFVGLFGLVGLFSSNVKNGSQMGILSLVVIGAAMGVFMTKYNDWVLPATGEKRKIPWSKLIIGLICMVLILLFCSYVLAIPALQVINPILPGFANLIIAAAAYGIRWLFRRHYQIIGSVFSPAAKNK